jgi:hypothetical protein
MVMAGDRAVRLDARPEAGLLLRCVGAPSDEDSRLHIETLVHQAIDWAYLLELALRHKVMPLLYRHINSFFPEAVPVEFMERLRDYFYLNAARNYLLEEELGRVLADLAQDGIACVPYKGPALAAQLYGDTALRQFSDLDIFIRREDALRAGEILRLRGYEREHELTASQEKASLKVDCQFMFVRESEGIYLELHWGFAPTYFPVALDAEAMWSRLKSVSIGSVKARAFSPEDLLLILCVNAGKEFWRGLQNLCDINELVRSRPELDWGPVTRSAKRAGARRMFFVSMLLARALLGTSVPEEVLQGALGDREAATIAREVGQKLFEEGSEGRGVLGFLKPAGALDGPLARMRFYTRLAATPTLEDWTLINLPEGLRFLYYLTRPFRLAGKYLRRWKSLKADGKV